MLCVAPLSALPMNYLQECAPAASWMDRPSQSSWCFGDIFTSGKLGLLAIMSIFYVIFEFIREKNSFSGCSADNHVSNKIYLTPVFVMWITFGIYPVLLISTLITPIYTPRHFLYLLAPCSILIVYFLSKLPKYIYYFSFVIIISILSLQSIQDTHNYRRDFDRLVAYLNSDSGMPCRIPYRPYGKSYQSPVKKGLDYYGLHENITRFMYDVSKEDYSFLETPCNAVVFSRTKPYTDYLEKNGRKYRLVKFGYMFVVKVEG
jgi:hypothetical protein